MSDVERRVLLLAKVYEKCRREAGQLGYRVERDGVINDSVFHQLETVVLFLKSHEVTVTWDDVNWQGYVRYVFQALSPVIPQPGQLRNTVLFRKYLKHSSSGEIDAIRSEDEMEKIYQRRVRKELRVNSTLMQLVGVQRI